MHTTIAGGVNMAIIMMGAVMTNEMMPPAVVPEDDVATIPDNVPVTGGSDISHAGVLRLDFF